jgi:NTP pyrophosphatase (non-canonical NTP hydrolase)
MNNPIDYIKNWRESFGLPVRTETQIPSKEEMKLALSLIAEELEELDDAIMGDLGAGTWHTEAIKLNEVADAIGDLYFVVSQMAFIFGFKPEELIKTVYESNMSKLDDNEEAAFDTIDRYAEKNINVYSEELPNGKYIIKRVSDNKVQKGNNFFEPKWTYDKTRNTEETK